MLSNARASDGVVDPADRESVNVAEIQRWPSGSALFTTGLLQSCCGKNTRYAVPDARRPRAGTWSASYPSPFGNENSARPTIVPGVPPNSRASVNVRVDCAVSESVFVAALRTACNGFALPPQPANATSANIAARIERGSCRYFKRGPLVMSSASYEPREQSNRPPRTALVEPLAIATPTLSPTSSAAAKACDPRAVGVSGPGRARTCDLMLVRVGTRIPRGMRPPSGRGVR